MAEHILLVDDDELLRRSLSFNLERAGYRVSTAVTTEDALARARRDPSASWIATTAVYSLNQGRDLREQQQS